MPLAILGQRNAKELLEKCEKQNIAQICSIPKIMLLWFQKMLCLISSKNRTNSCIMSAYHQYTDSRRNRKLHASEV